MHKPILNISKALLLLFTLFWINAVIAMPAAGPITEKEVKEYLTNLWIAGCHTGDGCSVSFDSPVRIGAAARHSFQIPATTYLCYPVKVNYTTHINSGTYHTTHYTNAVYYFYRNGFGEWEMNKENEKITYEKDAQQVTTAAINNTPSPANVAKYPKPNFAAMEKQFEIVKYDYPIAPSQEMTIYIKPKVPVNSRTGSFSMEFKDKAGNIVGVNPCWVCCSTQLGYTEMGATGKLTVNTPTAAEMAKVVSATVVMH